MQAIHPAEGSLPQGSPSPGSQPTAPSLCPSGSAPRRSANHLLELADRYRWWVFAAIALLYLAGFNGQWHVEPDSALYLTLARNLATGQGYTYHGQIDHLAYPGWPGLVAVSFKIFGVGNLLPAHVLMLGLALGVLGLTYRLFHLHADRPTAVMVTAMLAFNVCFYQYAYQLRNDMPFLAGVMAFLVGYEGLIQHERRGREETTAGAEPTARLSPRWLDWLAVLVGLAVAVVMRPTMIAFVGCIALAILYSIVTGRGHWRRLAVAALVLLAVAAFFSLDPRQRGDSASLGGYEEDMMGIFTHHDRLLATAAKAVHEYIPQLLRSTTAASFGHELGPGVNILGTVVVLALGVGLFKRRPLWGLWVAATVAMMLLTIPRDRYFLAILPLLAFAWWQLIVWLNRRLPFNIGNLLFCLLLALWLGPNTVKSINAAIQQHRTPFLRHYKSGRLNHVAAFAHALPGALPRDAIVLAPQRLGRILTYYSGLYVLDYWQFPATFPTAPDVYCVFPTEAREDKLDQWLAERHARLSPPLLSVRRDDRAKPKLDPWTLHRILPPATTSP